MRQTRGWFFHVAAGLALVILLGTHMTIMHLDQVTGGAGNADPALKPVDWENVTQRGDSPWMALFYIAFLGAALFHGLFGTRTILLETDFGARNRKTLTAVIVIVGFGLFIFGSAAAISFVQMSQAVVM
ncbi:hypothetical protein JXA80_11700 [bacterium]|nr:hypothetical protein [candidate division CSSED10-310 bacterium]